MSDRNRARRRRNTAEATAAPARPWLSREAKRLLVLGTVLAVVGFGMWWQASPVTSGSATKKANLVRADSYVEGPANAKVTLVEVLDPECESCREMYPIVERIRDEYAGRIRFVVRYFPNHSNSLLAVRAMEAAGRQDRYWSMYSLLFERQQEWGEKKTPQTEAFTSYARALGLDMQRFTKDLDDPAFTAKAERDRADVVAAGVDGTPTFFLNGKMIGYMLTYQQLKGQIESALR